MAASLARQAERLYRVFAELVRRYQFRDRDEIACHGLSVSQCYTLDALAQQGPLTMTGLAKHLHLEVSTMTRVIDYLVAAGFAQRSDDANDRRVRRIRITRKGRSLIQRIHTELIKEHEQVLREVRPESREAVISAVSHLLTAFKQRQRRLSDEADASKRRARKAG